jgi:uncharacterized membrane protein YeaQ/YmgE (transglycosylase-associated protein family)
MESFIFWIVFGALAGWIASLITGSDRGIVGDIIVGILGAILGGWLFTALGGQGVTGFNLPSLLVAVLGSIVLIWLVHAFRGDTSVRNQ